MKPIYFSAKLTWSYIRALGVLETVRFRQRRTKTLRGAPLVVYSTEVQGCLQLRNLVEDIKAFEKVFVWNTYAGRQIANAKSILDLGANIGLTTAFFSGRFPNAKVVALEPLDENFHLLCQNSRESKVIPLKKAVWGERATLTLQGAVERFDSASFGVQPVEHQSTSMGLQVVEAISIDELIDIHFDGLDVDLVKIDIEGGERELFAPGKTGWLRRCRSVICEFHDIAWERDAIKLCENLGFRAEKCGEDVLFQRWP